MQKYQPKTNIKYKYNSVSKFFLSTTPKKNIKKVTLGNKRIKIYQLFINFIEDLIKDFRVIYI